MRGKGRVGLKRFSLPSGERVTSIFLMKIIDRFQHMPPEEREIMFIRAAQGSAVIEGMEKAAQECEVLIQEYRGILRDKAKDQPISGENKLINSA